jgi:hypothetical protein
MKTNVALAVLAAAVSITAVSTPSFARSADAIAVDSATTVERAGVLPNVEEALAADAEPPAPSTEALAGAKAKMKHAWSSVKKGTSNLLGKRVKHMGKHTNRAGMQSKKGKENIVNFLHGGKKPTRRHSI